MLVLTIRRCDGLLVRGAVHMIDLSLLRIPNSVSELAFGSQITFSAGQGHTLAGVLSRKLAYLKTRLWHRLFYADHN